MIRAIGVVLACGGAWAVIWGVWAVYRRERPIDYLGAVLAFVGPLVLGLGVALACHPGFLS